MTYPFFRYIIRYIKKIDKGEMYMLTLDIMIEQLKKNLHELNEFCGMLECYRDLKKENLKLDKDSKGNVIVFKEKFPSLKKFECGE